MSQHEPRWVSWNPATGCTKVSEGCRNCYAERFAERWREIAARPYESGFELQLRPERLELPLRWRAPRLVFVDSMTDLFHEGSRTSTSVASSRSCFRHHAMSFTSSPSGRSVHCR